MARTLHVTLTTPEEKVFEGDATWVVVPAIDGELGILPRHAPLVGQLGYGELRVEVVGGGKERFFLQGGFLQVLEDNVSVLAETAVHAASLQVQSEEAALRDVVSRSPGRASFDEREAHQRALAVAKVRVRLAQRGG